MQRCSYSKSSSRDFNPSQIIKYKFKCEKYLEALQLYENKYENICLFHMGNLEIS